MTRVGTVRATGGCGFIGSHLAEALVAAGEHVRVLDDLCTSWRENLPPGVEFRQASTLPLPISAATTRQGLFRSWSSEAVARG